MNKIDIVPPTRANAAANELRRRILAGTYPAGTQLKQATLAAELGISRIPFREALIQLESEGLVQLEAHKGAVVSDVSADDIEELFELRALIEPTLLLKSAAKLTKQDYRRLHGILKKYSGELRDSHVERWGELNTELHLLLYKYANSPKMESLVFQLLKTTDRFIRMQLFYTNGRARAEHEHNEIVHLCEQGEFKKSSRILQKHITNAGSTLAKLIRKQKSQIRQIPK